MKVVSSEYVLERLKKEACSSSHFVWLIGNFNFVESSQGWVFAFTKSSSTLCFALEPLVPNAHGDYHAISEEELKQACEELFSFAGHAIISFTGIGTDFMTRLGPYGFQGMKVGRDPWIDLKHYMPKGNAGKGVRAAKNQAIKAGVTVEEWKHTELEKSPELQKEISRIFKDWSESTSLQISGFLLTSDPFIYPEERRYFVTRCKGRVEGYLVASPIYQSNSFYFEDLILLSDASRGSSELLLLEAMRILNESNISEVSLGVVGLADISWPAISPPLFFRKLVELILSIVPLFYNSKGIEVFRKRFKPHKWTDVYISVRPSSKRLLPPSVQWIQSIYALFRALNIHLTLRPRVIRNKIKRLILRHPYSFLFIVLATFAKGLGSIAILECFQTKGILIYFMVMIFGVLYLSMLESKIPKKVLGLMLLAMTILESSFLHVIEAEFHHQWDSKGIYFLIGLFGLLIPFLKPWNFKHRWTELMLVSSMVVLSFFLSKQPLRFVLFDFAIVGSLIVSWTMAAQEKTKTN